ncbi:MAG: kinase/pyrophosphorylase [Neisseriales bacterium]|jgi:regulator of PEP synthase PpsR (kinase-PPPase family)|nr:MAG: kinase/pyrophosphorylase [Neisseriales bacterium]HRG62349.1 pyruvate, water dikinase regulatory protein [Burkholderiales bacterium]
MRSVFYISDQTGITTEKLGAALLGKFPQIEFRKESFPFADTPSKISQALIRVKNRFLTDGMKPIIVSSVITPKLRKLLDVDYALTLDFFDAFIGKMEAELGCQATHEISKIHGIGDEDKYNHRIDAIHYSLDNDDGVSSRHYDEADIIIIGVSRVGKTPTSIYLSVNYGIKVANYPLAEADLQTDHLPKALVPYHHKLFGLSIEVERLHSIRTHRLPNSKYAQLNTCVNEIQAAERIMNHCGVPFLNTSHKSIEEISVAIMQLVRIKRQF